MNKVMTISLLAATFLFTACGEKTDETTAKAVESTKAAAQDIAHATKEAASKAMEEASAGAKTAADKVVEASKDVADKATVEAKKAVEKTEEALNAATVAATDSLANAAGEKAYAKCSGCHGADGKTKALGKSPAIAGVDKATLVTMLNGYKAGTLNKAGMGTLMKGQVASMDDATIEAVASYISTLK